MAKKQKRSVVTFLNPRTCGIYKNGQTRFKTDPLTGRRTTEIDNELIEAVEQYLKGRKSPGEAKVNTKDVFTRGVIVPTYFDDRYNEAIRELLSKLSVEGITLGELVDNDVLSVRGGHGSPGNDQRTGTIPYIKVSDIRGLRVNVNPTNLVSQSVAKRFWRGEESGLKAWDVVTPNRASSNIGEFAILLPGEETLVVTKEVFIFRVENDQIWDAFYLLWALSLKAVRDQWRRVALMQTNREDCGNRWEEITLPKPKGKRWAQSQSKAFRAFFTSLATAKEKFIGSVSDTEFEYVPNVVAMTAVAESFSDSSDGDG